ncbi:GpE family phage tail protein [Vibrio scophthalmi]|uniref:GpE family phage tail protein n=1 Tax=Vibrio scophthalmi TaxID=45658 RepID=A0A1E3WIY8_9VIBR|nr:GpE family phage tail protein [Vibrio scophthalmi]ODS09736.1 hypothetical protein VSF3289_03198 [Vibrio scophthalmi]
MPFERVEELYADIGFVFHWPPSEMDSMTLDDLLMFREMARVRHEVKSA